MGDFQNGLTTGNPSDIGINVQDINDAITALSNLDDQENWASELGTLIAHLENEADPEASATDLGLNVVEQVSDLNLGNMEDGAKVYIRDIGTAAEAQGGNLTNVGNAAVDGSGKSALPNSGKFAVGVKMQTLGDGKVWENTASGWTEAKGSAASYVEHGGDAAMAIPEYDSKSDEPDSQLAGETGSSETGLVIVDGSLYQVV